MHVQDTTCQNIQDGLSILLVTIAFRGLNLELCTVAQIYKNSKKKYNAEKALMLKVLFLSTQPYYLNADLESR